MELAPPGQLIRPPLAGSADKKRHTFLRYAFFIMIHFLITSLVLASSVQPLVQPP
jgi:hypothetical protein